MTELLKQCSRGNACVHPNGPWLPATIEYFQPSKSRRGATILLAECRFCRRARNRAWRTENEEKAKETDSKSYRKHRNARIAKVRQYRLNNPSKGVKYQQARRARKSGLPANFTEADWRYALDYFDYCCAACGRPKGTNWTLAQDHWIPLSLGGGTTPNNIVPLCHGIGGCNNQKHAQYPHQWLIENFVEELALEIEQRIIAFFKTVRGADQEVNN